MLSLPSLFPIAGSSTIDMTGDRALPGLISSTLADLLKWQWSIPFSIFPCERRPPPVRFALSSALAGIGDRG